MSSKSLIALASPLFALAFILLAPQQAQATYLGTGELLIESGATGGTTGFALTNVHLLDQQLDSGFDQGGGAGGGGGGGLLPALLSLVIPGLGQVWNGQILKGIVVFVVVGVLYGGGAWVFGGLGALLGLVVHVIAIVDAYRNGGLIPGGGGDVSPASERILREEQNLVSRFESARPGVAVAMIPMGPSIAW